MSALMQPLLEVPVQVKEQLGPELTRKVIQHYQAYDWGDTVLEVIGMPKLSLMEDGNPIVEVSMKIAGSMWLYDAASWRCEIVDGKVVNEQGKGQHVKSFLGKPGMTFDKFMDKAKELNLTLVMTIPEVSMQHKFIEGPWDGQERPLPGERIPLAIRVPDNQMNGHTPGMYKLRLADSTEELAAYLWKPFLPENLPSKDDLNL